jgi:hypothetical protein
MKKKYIIPQMESTVVLEEILAESVYVGEVKGADIKMGGDADDGVVGDSRSLSPWEDE